MTILFQMAKKRLESDAFYNDLMSSYQDLYFKFNAEQEKPHELKEPLKTTLLYSYVDQIKRSWKIIKMKQHKNLKLWY